MPPSLNSLRPPSAPRGEHDGEEARGDEVLILGVVVQSQVCVGLIAAGKQQVINLKELRGISHLNYALQNSYQGLWSSAL
jgi:hypothetical protein